MTDGRLSGMVPPMVVPFGEDGEIDEEAFRSEARFLLSCDVSGISTGGSTGEGALLSDRELRRCLEIVQEENSRKKPVYAGVIRNSTQDTIRAASEAKALGADVLLITPVFYHSATPEGNYEYFRDIAKAVSLPIIIYNVIATNIIAPETFRKIAEIDEVIGIKQVDPVKLAEIVDGSSPETLVFSACDQLLYGTYVSGACGAISALVTIAPELCVEQWNAYLSGNQERAMELHRILIPIVRTYLQPPYPGKVKELINLQGRHGGIARKPTTMPDDERREKMKAALKSASLLK